jgi:uncharacterized protein YkwD
MTLNHLQCTAPTSTLLALSLALLTACGGSGSSDDNTGTSTDTINAVSATTPQASNAQTQAAQPSMSTEWWELAGEGASFNVASKTWIRYGNADIGWAYKRVSGAGTCSNEFFGFDPKPMGYRHCYFVAGTDPVPVVGAAPAPTPIPTPVPAPPVGQEDASAPKATCGLTGFAAEALARINAFRARAQTCGDKTFAAAPALKWSPQLNLAAQVHSEAMAKASIMDHQLLGEVYFTERATNAGYNWRSLGENIGIGPTVKDALGGWETSPAHCANMMTASHQDVGLACVKDSIKDPYWTMVLGSQ